MSTAAIGALGQQGQQVTTGHDVWGEVDLNEFVKLLVTELQNQDPLDPMKNQEILQQISQIRAIASNQRLTDTLQSVLLGQTMATASGMIGEWVTGLSDDAEQVSGRVERISVEDGVARLLIGDHAVSLKNISHILSEDLGQDVAVATGMIDRMIVARTDATPLLPSQDITGLVQRVSIENGVAKLHVGEHTVGLNNVVEVLSSTENDT